MLRNRTHSSPRLQEEWNRFPDLTHWSFRVLARVEGKRQANEVEARCLLQVPEEKRLSLKSKTAVQITLLERITELLVAGVKYKDIANELGISMGTISHVKNCGSTTFRRRA